MPVDIDDNLIDPLAVESAVTSRTVGISPTQLNGRTCNMDAIMAIAKKRTFCIGRFCSSSWINF